MGNASPEDLNWLAAYAAFVATLSVAWHAFTWYQTRRTRFAIYLSLEANPNFVAMEVHNLSEHKVYVRWAGFEKQRARSRFWDKGHVVVFEPENQVAAELEPRAMKMFGMNRERFERAGFDRNRKLRTFVVDAEGRRHRSKGFLL